jgi:transcriptional regulator with PAS, ATPase and Fis domain
MTTTATGAEIGGRVNVLAGMRLKKNVELVGGSPEILALQHELERVARSDAKVLITGESGVGKEIVARSIHTQSSRSHHVFAPVNCAGLPETLLESELFGHVKGSFTGAYRDKPGKMETAHLGTVFLDEVGEMTLRMQGLLLRFLETGELQKIGADGGSRHVNVRIIAATNRDLRQLVSQGTFREDLFYRLNVIHIAVPPLRERRQDIPALLNHFLVQFASANGTPMLSVSPDAMNALMMHSWPGNVRELENAIERLVVTQQSGTIDCEHLPHEIRNSGSVRAVAPKRERRKTAADDLYKRITENGESFWDSAYPMFMEREITRANIRDLIVIGLRETRGSYKILIRLFKMAPRDYKRFLNFLRKHDCHVPFKDYR